MVLKVKKTRTCYKNSTALLTYGHNMISQLLCVGVVASPILYAHLYTLILSQYLHIIHFLTTKSNNNHSNTLVKIAVQGLRSQTENPYVQTVPDKTCLCLDHLRRKVSMSRFSCVQKYLCVVRAFKSAYVQIFVRSKSHMARLLCVPNQKSCTQVLKICACMSRLSCVQKRVCPDYRAFTSRPIASFSQIICKQRFLMYSFEV